MKLYKLDARHDMGHDCDQFVTLGIFLAPEKVEEAKERYLKMIESNRQMVLPPDDDWERYVYLSEAKELAERFSDFTVDEYESDRYIESDCTNY